MMYNDSGAVIKPLADDEYWSTFSWNDEWMDGLNGQGWCVM